MNEQKRRIFEDTLTKPYDQGQYIGFVRELLNNVRPVVPCKDMKPWNTFSAAVDHYNQIGNYMDGVGNRIALLSVCLANNKNIENARSMQRSFVKTLLENSNCAGALVAFYNAREPKKWRLSLVRMDYTFAKGRISEKLTPAKRYSYLVGEGEPCHTAKERLYPIFASDDRNPSLDELEDAFSVEAVTKDFFDQYRDKYLDLKEYLDSNPDFLSESQSRGFDSEQFAKKLMGQIVFLYFIQKKGWLGVNAFPAKMKESEYKSAFYRPGRKPKELMPSVYKRGPDGMFYRDIQALLALSPEDETTLSTLVKGDKWGDGPKDFVHQIFNGCAKAGKNFFDDYLEPLFYTGLNQNRGENAFFPPLHRRIPFLNGGLFEELDGYDWRNNNFCIPNDLFSNKDEKGREADGILDVFDRYNFTMAEDEPMEREVAIDPEMLGKVFENLLDVSDRKSKGAFYTPREIVHYMCQESLINYLVTRTQIPEADIRKLILYGEYFRDEDAKKTLPVDKETGQVLQGSEIYFHKHYMEFDREKDMEIPETIFSYKKKVNRLPEIDKLLANIKVVDPAVGSGAFPLGMLNEIVKARDTITTYMAIDMNRAQRLSYRAERSPYRLKHDTIKNCIFACDIEASATDIAKLRLWLSLVIDDQIMDMDDDKFGYTTKPRELPNLDCNVICGNSLVDEFYGVPLITESSALGNLSPGRWGNLCDQRLAVLINELIELQSKLYDEKDHVAKDSFKEQIQDVYNQIILEQLKGNSKAEEAYYQAIQQQSKPFVLWQLYFPKVFRDNGGFDVVIGNPPYIGEHGHKEIFREIADTNFGKKYYQGKMDFFYFFFHKGLDVLNKNGELAFITTNYYSTATGAKKLRTDLKTRTFIRRLINFNEIRVFESALGQHNMITLLTKNKTNQILCISTMCTESLTANAEKIEKILSGIDEKTSTIIVDQDNLYDGTDNYIRQNGVVSKTENSIGSILDKMSASIIHLSNICEINQGIISGCDYVSNRNISDLNLYQKDIQIKDGIFVLDLTNTRDKLRYESFSDEEKKLFCKPFFKNSEISKYHCNLENTKILIYIGKETASLNNYINIKNHLERFIPVLKRRREVQTGAIKYFQLQWARVKTIFEGGKIVVPYRTRDNSFAYNSGEWFCRSDIYVITPKNNIINIFTVLGILNSKLVYIWLYNRGKRKGEILELVQVPLSEIPIPQLDNMESERIADLAKTITEIKNKNRTDTSELEDEIDSILYNAFRLTKEEINLAENFVGCERTA